MNVEIADNVSQEAWLVWGDREGPGVGWHVKDDRPEGYVHDGDSVTTVPLRTGFDAGESWNLTAFYNPSEGVQYYVGETASGETSTLGSSGGLELSTMSTIAPPAIDADASIDAAPAGGRERPVRSWPSTSRTPLSKTRQFPGRPGGTTSIHARSSVVARLPGSTHGPRRPRSRRQLYGVSPVRLRGPQTRRTVNWVCQERIRHDAERDLRPAQRAVGPT